MQRGWWRNESQQGREHRWQKARKRCVNALENLGQVEEHEFSGSNLHNHGIFSNSSQQSRFNKDKGERYWEAIIKE